MSESCTACSMMVSSTSSRSRLELTTSPTSLRASSCSTLRASSWVLVSSACTRLTLFNAIAAWPANVPRIALARSSNGDTSLRHSDIAPTTSSSRIIGADIVVRKPARSMMSRRP